jgi:hypothetical protein
LPQDRQNTFGFIASTRCVGSNWTIPELGPETCAGNSQAFADRDRARRLRQDASPGMATPEGDDFSLSPARSDGLSDRRGPTAQQRYERM